MARTHNLKISQRWYDRLVEGLKTSELRRNDRDFQVGDKVAFLIPAFGLEGQWNAPFPIVTFEITHVLSSDACEGLEHGFCIISLKKLND